MPPLPIFFIIAAVFPALNVFVAPTGSDTNAGTAEAPFATLMRARDEIRAAKANSDELKDGATVTLADGNYRLDAPLLLTADDRGMESAPIVWRAANQGKARIFGGIEIPSDGFHPVTSPDILARIPEGARAAILSADLKSLGVTEFGEWPDGFEGALAVPELFFNDERMNLAHWPNEGWAEIATITESGPAPWRNHESDAFGAFTYSGDQPARWTTAPTVWIEGYWCFDWAAETIRVQSINTEKKEITLAKKHVYGLGSGNKAQRRFRAVNLLEELDQSGEYFLDSATGTLYFWPPGPLEGSRIVLSRLREPMIQITDASHIRFEGIVIENCAGTAIRVTGGNRVTLAGCVIRNTGQNGVSISGGEAHAVQSCDIYDTGATGLEISGGDRKFLTPCGHTADNNHIHDISCRMRTHAVNIQVGGVGVRMTHNLLTDAPHQGIMLSGNDHLFELNEVARIGMASDDCGAFYMGRNPSERGTMIRHNFWREIGSNFSHGSCAIYFDDGAGGQTVEGNIFYKASGGDFGAVFNHGGHDNLVANNIFIDCSRAIGASPWPAAYWKKWLGEPLWQDKLLMEIDITSPPYIERYPQLAGFMASDTQLRLNRAERNIAVRCGSFANGNWDISDCVTLTYDPGFENEETQNFQLNDDAEILKRVPGFQKIPFEKIGVYSDSFRPVLPDRR